MKMKYFLQGIAKEVIIALLLGALLTACQPAYNPSVSNPQISALDIPVFNGPIYIRAYSLSDLTNKASLVVIGKAVGTGNVFNMARDVDDISKPDPNLFGIGQVYEFEISRYLKGEQEVDGAERISVVQVEGMIILSAQEPPTMEQIETARSQYKSLPINLDSEYILFLEPLKYFPELTMHFTGTAHPWRFVLANECVYPVSPEYDAIRFFPPQPVDDFMEQVENAPLKASEPSMPIIYVTPDGGEAPICPELTEPNPYP